jgi:hypothetical protein
MGCIAHEVRNRASCRSLIIKAERCDGIEAPEQDAGTSG